MNRKRLNFIIVFKQDPEYRGYVSEVVNLPGCMSQGKTLKEAEKNTMDAISMCLETRMKKIRDFKKAIVVTTLLKDCGDYDLYNQSYG